MKRLCLILAYLFLFTQTASAMPLLVGQKVVYRGTVTGLRISAVDGTAFIDNLPLTYSSDFSAGVDGWAAIQGTAAGNIDSIGGEDNWLRFTTDTGNVAHYLDNTITLVKGRKYNVTFTYYIPSGQSNIDGVRFFENSGANPVSPILMVVDSATTVSYTFTSVGSSRIRFYSYDGDLAKFQDPGGDDVFYIKDIKISEIQPFMDGNHQIEIYDSSNRMLKGVLKAAGSGETLGDELSVSWTNRVLYEFETLTAGAGNTLTCVINTTGSGSAFTGSVTAGQLIKNTNAITLNSGTMPTVALSRYTSGVAGGHWVAFTANGTSYITAVTESAIALTISVYSGVATNFALTEFSAKQVLTPSSSGATIVSAKGGEVYNFSYKNASFTYNAASYYVIIRAIR